MNIPKIFEHNRQWVSEKLSLDPDYFVNLAKGQSPALLYIGCSDSRVTAEELIGAQPGDLFVHRNIANMVPNTDLSVMCVINFAVNHLKVKDIVVCGHFECGGVKAAMQPQDMGVLNPWLGNIRDVFRLHQEELDAIDNDGQRFRRLVELNVQEQCINVLKTSDVQNAFQSRQLGIHGWVFDIGTGTILDLQVDVDKLVSGIGDIYSLA